MSRVDDRGIVSFADHELAPLLRRFEGTPSVQDLRDFFEALQGALATCAERIHRGTAARIVAAVRADLDAAAAATPVQTLVDAMAFLIRKEVVARPDRALELLLVWPVPSVISGKATSGWPSRHGAELTLTVQGFLAEIDSVLSNGGTWVAR